MKEGLFYLVSSFWFGALHAATPGHGKTIAASYIVGARGRPVDAFVLGIFVTLSHTSGIILVAILATLGSAWVVPHRLEAYLAVGTGVLVVGIGLWMLRNQLRGAGAAADRGRGQSHAPAGLEHTHPHRAEPHDHTDPAAVHRHGWGPAHTHDLEAIAAAGPSLGMLLGLGVAGGFLPDPGALAILLASIANGRLILGLFTVVVFSVGFASVLVLVGIVAASVGQMVLAWLSSRWVVWLQTAAALLIVLVGLMLTATAWRTVAMLG
jgi:nickel/cobalt transporter (NicO) family protein